MKEVLKIGDKKTYQFCVTAEDFAAFEGRIVHQVCSTFVLAREIEWATRQYVLECKEEHEEGIGTLLEIQHLGPALEGEEVSIHSEIDSIQGTEIICSFEASVGKRKIAKGRTGQKVLPKEKIEAIFASLKIRS